MKVTISTDEGIVYDTFVVEYKHTRLGWLLIDATGDTLTVDEALQGAFDYVDMTEAEARALDGNR